MSNTTLPIREWSDGYVALKRRAGDLRGWIELNSQTPDWERWPRTTGADVIAIAAFVDRQLRQQRWFRDSGVARRWRTCLADLELLALPALGDIYDENRAFWACLARAFVYLSSVEARLPPQATWDVLLARLGTLAEHRNVGPKGDGPFKHFDGVKTFDDLYLAQFQYLRGLRGEDRMDEVPGMPGSKGPFPVPRTTNSDIILLADYWAKQLASVKRVDGHERTTKNWGAAMADVNAIARKGDPNTIYPSNHFFWRVLEQTAIQIAVADEAPSDWDRAVNALEKSITELPKNIAKGAEYVAEKVAGVAGDVASGAGNIVNKGVKGMFSGIGTPLLVAGGLVGAFLLLRGRDKAPSATE